MHVPTLYIVKIITTRLMRLEHEIDLRPYRECAAHCMYTSTVHNIIEFTSNDDNGRAEDGPAALTTSSGAD